MKKDTRLFTLSDYEQLKKEVHKANQRIQRLTAKYGERSWATIGLYNKLEDKKIFALSKTGYIRLNKNWSDVKLKYIEQVVKNFNSPETKTSTIRGAEEAIANTKQSIKEHFTRIKRDRKTGEEIKVGISDEQAGKLYEIVKNKDLRPMSEQFDPSETWARLVRAKEKNLSYDEFAMLFDEDAKKFSKQVVNDLDVKEYLTEIYNLYM